MSTVVGIGIPRLRFGMTKGVVVGVRLGGGASEKQVPRLRRPERLRSG
jgi:hypothetical protein